VAFNKQEHRFVYHTEGVCPPEIHFKIQKEHLKQVRFVGGGCPGNAQLVCRLLEEKPIHEVLELLKGIPCRNDTSCPDQLAKALIAATSGDLNPAPSFQVYTDLSPRNRIGLIGDLGGRSDILKILITEMREMDVEIIYCMGNLTGASVDNKDLIRLIRKQGLLAIQGERDWRYAQDEPEGNLPFLGQKERDYIFRLPHVISFRMKEKSGVVFFGDYIQSLPGFSDFEPFALEMNMVCGLTQFMQDETVFPALEAMVPQFKAHIILFSQIKKWGHWQIGGTDFISLGPAIRDHGLSWGLLEESGKKINFEIINTDLPAGG
jgi:uncharacterized protein (TIGR03905 family)